MRAKFPLMQLHVVGNVVSLTGISFDNRKETNATNVDSVLCTNFQYPL